MKKILITGSSGFIGGNLIDQLSIGEIIPVFGPNTKQDGGISIDLTVEQNVQDLFDVTKPDIIIHLAGNKDLVSCENQFEEASKINVDAVKFISEKARGTGCKIIYFSTDYVFDGQSGNYTENSKPNPKSKYGQMKLAGENIVSTSGCRYAIIRSGAVYGKGAKFLNWARQSLEKGERIQAINDSYFTPTFIEDIAKALQVIILKNFEKIIHVAGPDRVSRFDMIRMISSKLGIRDPKIEPISLRDANMSFFPDLSLDSSNMLSILGFEPTSLEEGLSKVLH
ncbi:hypothetical protein CH373_12345 [Leptospira perolatii]|uniref:RmlD-like substrate binding domain-containing protein n=1 Tax=Leptospira perolatii TaxID=2023191 RepID=A0A2M9ZLM0_9LEPT|nr:SDR family oxidoreductase [Leptospira perolatii]PJZ70273.1 hypothetical protein CH360_06625 [Leptospira perolatii]PJZ72843.1 hypothetical protein CH373_12345 [Leptospira perolatii]